MRVLTGIRPTGPLHLGHYVGALRQWIPLQEEHECFFLIADIQAMTTHINQPELIRTAVFEIVRDWVGVDLDPNQPNVHFVLQSAIPELTELTTYLSMVTPFSWMTHNPTIGEELKGQSDASVGFMAYVVSQAADILFVSKDPASAKEPILVPVGEDQIPHLRDTNRIARRFNRFYGDTFLECEPIVGDVGRLVGTDGQAKMSKSVGNTIQLGDSPEAVRERVMSMYTDPNRIHATDPGTVEGNPVFIYHDAFNDDVRQVADFKRRYRQGRVGDVVVKKALADALERFLGPIRERRHVSDQKVRQYLEEGTAYARSIARNTMGRVREHIQFVKMGGT